MRIIKAIITMISLWVLATNFNAHGMETLQSDNVNKGTLINSSNFEMVVETFEY
ncbi:exported hypothetical protein [Desulfamplus magnetovallimortis]|uniref:Uncharacterized protein n=1 Tax=Desulfamplus magnetovallimortis TaxID=1246637 RepID=A0A1W1HGA9_9BACT|nr:hypothetical protein [Desulfamplus magnetovallimortis]SLM31514.1 exported hypothetical protein [Desulfamplus magnetovallimortis]